MSHGSSKVIVSSLYRPTAIVVNRPSKNFYNVLLQWRNPARTHLPRPDETLAGIECFDIDLFLYKTYKYLLLGVQLQSRIQQPK